MSGLADYEELCDDLLARTADLERARMMGYASLKKNGKLVACFSAAEDAMVFKLADPEAQAEAFALDGAHLFDPSGGRSRPFRDWVAVPHAHAEHWAELADAALS